MKVILYLSCFLFLVKAQAQKPQFSQFYSSSNYQNPAFAGHTNKPRFMATTRFQWPELASIKTHLFSADLPTMYNKHGSNTGGIGVNVVLHNQDQWYKQLKINGQFAHRIRFNNLNIRLGVQAGFDRVQIGNLSSYTFVDQFIATGNGMATSNSIDPLASVSYSSKNFETGGGIILDWNRNTIENPRNFLRWWIGASFEYSAYNPFLHEQFELNHRIYKSIHGGVKIPVEFIPLNNTQSLGERDEFLSFIANFRKHYGTSQLDLMTQFTYSPLLLGLGYRGIPLKKIKNSLQHDALVASVGLRFGRYLVQYSYDQTISTLRGYTGGSHEVSLWVGITENLFKFDFPKSKRKQAVDCFSFD